MAVIHLNFATHHFNNSAIFETLRLFLLVAVSSRLCTAMFEPSELLKNLLIKVIR